MALEYTARALGIHDSPDGKKVLCWRMSNGIALKIIVDPLMAEFVIQEITPPQEP
jgi:hypothetical protein